MRLIADLGLILLVALGLESATGLVLFAFAHGLTPKGSDWAARVFDVLAALNLLTLQDVSFQTDLHVWVGYGSTGVVALKAIASWSTLTGWWPRRLKPRRLALEKFLAWSVFILAPVSYTTGLMLAFRIFPLANRLMRDLHLWSSLLLLLPLAWHVLRFLPTSLKIARVQLRSLSRRLAAPHPDLPHRR